MHIDRRRAFESADHSVWRIGEDYNHCRRHSALGHQAPAVYAAARTHRLS
jgi:transposase InsO family protein